MMLKEELLLSRVEDRVSDAEGGALIITSKSRVG